MGRLAIRTHLAFQNGDERSCLFVFSFGLFEVNSACKLCSLQENLYRSISGLRRTRQHCTDSRVFNQKGYAVHINEQGTLFEREASWVQSRSQEQSNTGNSFLYSVPHKCTSDTKDNIRP
jgi:hypothetical protein